MGYIIFFYLCINNIIHYMSSKKDRYHKQIVKLNIKKTQTVNAIIKKKKNLSYNFDELNNSKYNSKHDHNKNNTLLESIHHLLSCDNSDLVNNIKHITTTTTILTKLNNTSDHENKIKNIITELALIKHNISKENSKNKKFCENIRNVEDTMQNKLTSEQNIFASELERTLDNIEIYNNEYILDYFDNLTSLNNLKAQLSNTTIQLKDVTKTISDKSTINHNLRKKMLSQIHNNKKRLKEFSIEVEKLNCSKNDILVDINNNNIIIENINQSLKNNQYNDLNNQKTVYKKRSIKLDRELKYISSKLKYIEDNKLKYHDNHKHVSKSEMISLKLKKKNLENLVNDLKNKIKYFRLDTAYDNYFSKLNDLLNNDYLRAKNRLSIVKKRYNSTKSDIISKNNNLMNNCSDKIDQFKIKTIELNKTKTELIDIHNKSNIQYHNINTNILTLKDLYAKYKDIVRDLSDIHIMI